MTVFAAAMSACNKDSDSTSYEDTVNVAVTSFSLKYDSSNSGLDSVYFSIDLEHGVIFNADSLRKGTQVNKVVPTIKFANTVSSAVITMTGGTTRTGDVDYKKNPTDSIDFTGDVTLKVEANDGAMSKTYRIKVNVHKQDPDSLVWNELARAELPSRLPNPAAQRTVQFGTTVFSVIEENDGTYTIATSSDVMANRWTKVETQFPFRPVIDTFTASDEGLYILSDTGDLYEGTDAIGWKSTGENWTELIGAYTTTVVGLKQKEGVTTFAQYPVSQLNEKAAPADFPRTDMSNFVTLQNKWTSSPVAFFAGGVKADGSLSNATWAFDGSEWIKLCEGGFPEVEGASIIPYYAYRENAKGNGLEEFSVWMLLGGRKADGTFNRTVYISYDNGVNWGEGNSALQLPDMIPAMTQCDNVVMGTQKSANLSDAWKLMMRRGPKRVSYRVDGDIIYWDCPYIYLFGGYDQSHRLYNTIWCGVLTRLTFAPVI